MVQVEDGSLYVSFLGLIELCRVHMEHKKTKDVNRAFILTDEMGRGRTYP